MLSKIKRNLAMESTAWQFMLDGESQKIEVNVKDLVGKVYISLNGNLIHTDKLSSLYAWQNVAFNIENNRCNFIYTIGDLFGLEDKPKYSLIVNGYSVVTGELYNFNEEKSKYLKKHNSEIIRMVIGFSPGVFLAGFILGNMKESLLKNFLGLFIVLPCYFIVTKIFDFLIVIIKGKGNSVLNKKN